MTINFGFNQFNIPINPFMNLGMMSFQMPMDSFNIPLGGSVQMPMNMPIGPSFDFTKLFNFSMPTFNFSNFNFGSVTSSVKGNCKPTQKLDKEFLNKVKQIAKRINCDYKDLLAVMHSESGLNSKAVNKNGGATGLIQFLPSTARQLGTTTEALRNMTPIQQLDYVEKFFNMNKKAFGVGNRKLTSGDLYTLVFMPAKINNEVITSKGSAAYKANKGLDANGDGMITKSELANRVMKHRVNESVFLA